MCAVCVLRAFASIAFLFKHPDFLPVAVPSNRHFFLMSFFVSVLESFVTGSPWPREEAKEQKKRKAEQTRAKKKEEAEARKAAKKADGEGASKRRKKAKKGDSEDGLDKPDHRNLQRPGGTFNDNDPRVLVDGAQFSTSCRLTPLGSARKFLKSILQTGWGLLRLKKGSVKKVLTESMQGGFAMNEDVKTFLSSNTQV